MSTVPCGAWSAAVHKPMLLVVRTKLSPAFTRPEGACHCTVTQGWGKAPITKEHPAMVKTSSGRTIMAPAGARDCRGEMETCPPCGHIIMSEAVRIWAISRYLQRAVVH